MNYNDNPTFDALPNKETVKYKIHKDYPKYVWGNDGSVFYAKKDGTYRTVSGGHNPVTGYRTIQLRNTKTHTYDTYLIHRMIASLFKRGNRTNLEVDHIDGNKLNNHIDNLRWVSRKTNMRSGWEDGRFAKIGPAISAKRKAMDGRVTDLCDQDVRNIRQMKKDGFTNKVIAALYDIHYMSVSRITNYRTFRHVA